MPSRPRSLRHAAKKRKCIIDTEEEEFEEGIELSPARAEDLSNQRARVFGSNSTSFSVISSTKHHRGPVVKLVPKAKRSCRRKVMRTQRDENAKAWSSSFDELVCSKSTRQPLSSGELDYDSSDEENEGRYGSLKKVSHEAGQVKHKMAALETKGFIGKGNSGKACKMVNEKKICRKKPKRKRVESESESEEEWEEHDEKQREQLDNKRTLRRRCVSSNRFLEENFMLLDWVDEDEEQEEEEEEEEEAQEEEEAPQEEEQEAPEEEEEELASVIGTRIGGSDYVNTSKVQSSDDNTKVDGNLSEKRRCGDSSKSCSSSLSSSPSSSSSSPSSVSKRNVRNAVKRSAAAAEQPKVNLQSFYF